MSRSMRRSSRPRRRPHRGPPRRRRSSTAPGAGGPMRNNARSGGLFVGRLTAENGTATLLEALDFFPGARVDVIGAGPEELRLRAHPRIRLLGRVSSNEVQERMGSAAYLVMPSLSYEHEPRPLIEA